MTATDSAVAGSDWTDIENDCIVVDYFAMLAEELAGRPYVKAVHRRAVAAQTGRSEPSVERKYMNISAVLMKLGEPRIRGYAPNAHAQFNSLVAAIERHYGRHPKALGPEIETPIVIPAVDPFVDPPPLQAQPDAVPEPIRRLTRKFDPVARDARNRALGLKGERFVLEVEQRRLSAAGRDDLAEAVVWESQIHGDGAGYDIRSFDPDSGNERLIEVKATCGDATMPFFVSRNEEQLSLKRPTDFRLYRVFDLAIHPRIFAIRPPLRDFLRLETAAWRATFG
jgi:hypothetical protein